MEKNTKIRHWSTAWWEMKNKRQEEEKESADAWTEAIDFSCALAGFRAVGGEGETDPVRLKSSSESRNLQAVSKCPADISACVKSPVASWSPPVFWLR